mmetsp:Transcript_20709/g.26936  ORF Transcript_20709/g.26936 Transcript_20709/m.26936 type:complete len:991 (+) Transcript_20709:124-3096(+)
MAAEERDSDQPIKKEREVEAFLEKQNAKKISPRDFEVDNDLTSFCGTVDILNCCPSRQQLNDLTLCNRMVMATVAVILLWTSSLGVSLAIVRYALPTPSNAAVYSTCSYAFEVSSEERSAYIDCAERQVDLCDEIFEETSADILAVALENGEYNSDLLTKAKAHQASCATSTTTVQASLGVWQDGGLRNEVEYDSTVCDDDDLANCEVGCSLDDSFKGNSTCTCADVATMINDISAARSEAYTQSTGYSSYSQSVVSSLATYANDRARYDAEYLANHTEGTKETILEALAEVTGPLADAFNQSFADLLPNLDELIACVSMRDSVNYTACDVEAVRERFQEIADQLASQLSQARDAFSEYEIEASNYVSNIDISIDNMASFYDGFKSWIGGTSINTDDLGDYFGLSFDSFTVSDPSWPSSIGITSEFDNIPGANYLWNEVSEVFDELAKNITLAQLLTMKRADEWVESVNSMVETFPGLDLDDYDPPVYSDYTDEENINNVTEANEQFVAESATFEASSAENLAAFSEVNSYDDDDYTFSSYNFSIGDDAANYITGLYFPFEPLVGSNIKFNIWMTSIGDVTALLVIFDYLYRGYQSFAIFARFWSRSGMNIPDVDMRVDRDQTQFQFMSPVHVAFSFLTSPVVWFTICGLFLAIFIFYFCAIYIPILDAYKGGCVIGGTNGTFLTNNMYSVSYNYAASDGNEDIFNGISDYNVAKSEYCSTYATSTQNAQNENALNMQSLIASHTKTRDNSYMIRQCLDEDAMDTLFQAACCGSAGYDACSAYGTDDLWLNSSYTCPEDDLTSQPFDLSSVYLGDSSCLEPADWNEWDLKDGVLDCSEIPDCATSCGGPSQDLLRAVTEQCGCSAEWLMHASFLRASIGFCVYVILNVTRVLFVSALCQLLWRYLSPGLFTYQATCDSHGNVLAPRDTEKYSSFTGPRGSLKRELNRTLLRFVSFAWLQIFLSAALNGIWIYFLINAQHNIEYDASAVIS